MPRAPERSALVLPSLSRFAVDDGHAEAIPVERAFTFPNNPAVSGGPV
ncbi:hypothetical protein [Saccharomonospora sp.]|nr:hypothetical protein [Saccharomonospora sp.]